MGKLNKTNFLKHLYGLKSAHLVVNPRGAARNPDGDGFLRLFIGVILKLPLQIIRVIESVFRFVIV